MKTRLLRSSGTTATLSLAFCMILGGCARWEHASVSVTYRAPTENSDWNLIDLPRKQVERAFTDFSAANGYKCRAHVKRVEEITCRGPHDLYLTFQPAMNKPEFVAKFSWVDLSGRTHEEFMGHVHRFGDSLRAATGVVDVRITEG